MVSLRKYSSKCRKLCHKARLTKQNSDFERYKKYRNILNRLKLSEKKKHYTELFQKIGKNSQLLWNVVNNLLKKRQNKIDTIDLFSGDKKVSDDISLCNLFNEHFATAGSKIQESIVTCNSGKKNDRPGETVQKKTCPLAECQKDRCARL